jgi:hypothetical protein
MVMNMIVMIAAPATLAMRTGAPLLPTAVYFQGRGHHAIVGPAVSSERRLPSERNDERKLVLGAVTRVAAPQSLKMLLPYLDDKALRGTAAAAAVAVSEKIVEFNPAEVAEAMRKSLNAGIKGDLAVKAQNLLDQAERRLQKK